VPVEDRFWRGESEEPSSALKLKIKDEVKHNRRIKPELSYRQGPIVAKIVSKSPTRKDFKPTVNPSALYRLENITDDVEIDWDVVDYDRHKIEVEGRKEFYEEKAKKRVTHKSCDDEIFREIYDDFGAGWSSESDVSFISFPPQNKKIVYNNMYMMSKVSFLGDKIKSKFQYNNVKA
jgi:hypothetical protein